MMEADAPPLAGLRVLDLSRVLAGPYCCSMLGDLGAEVIKVERPGTGDENRHWGHLWHGVSLDFLNVNRNKRGITLDLSRADGQAIARQLAARADVLVENFIPGTLERFGLGDAQLRPANPRLIYCSISGYGEDGPLATKPGYDGAVQAFSGHMNMTGEADGGPVRTGASMIDMSTGFVAYGAIMTALLRRGQTGQGQKLSCSLFRTALALMGTHGAVFLNSGIEPRRAGSGVSHLAPYGAYPTADGHVVAAALNEASWVGLCEAIGCADLLSDPRFADPQARLAHRKALDTRIADAFRQRPTEDWVALFEARGLVVSPVNDLDHSFNHPQVAASRMVMTCATGDGPLHLVNLPFAIAGKDPDHARRPPTLGEDTAAILAELGYEPAAIAQFRADKIV